MLKKVTSAVLAAGAILGARRLFAPDTPARRALVSGGDRVAAELHRLADQWEGTRYRLRGRHPDPDVDDRTLADRIRSTIGPLEKGLDLPHIHVMVVDRTALLHGAVGSAGDAATIEAAVTKISGVRGVESYLHIGLLPSDSRPSAGRSHAPPSEAKQRLVNAATSAGVDEGNALAVVRTTLAAFTERLPAGERGQLVAHLPRDVRALLQPARRHGEPADWLQSIPELVGRVVPEAGTASVTTTTDAVRSILGELRALVPEEAADVSSVLPSGLRELWTSAPIEP
ncbi:MAG TPA: DUF2267 domain-containing protein [Actinophytocola sp.]|jgi:uncharacterized protein (DUF2267 family)|uniref:DUF2267 domain-containing protein n=1 Tax=Actinophytocola sp. TaxID=1872138 RepID=UPI002DFA5B7E|nr:DUF2267 domain-containing protein [Actinophytocola sp.]